jgi:hypothetical protein
MKELLKTIFILYYCIFVYRCKSTIDNIENEDDISMPLQVVIDSALTRNGICKFRNQEIGLKSQG